ncbi:MAG: transposon-encoded TnpW family protein [Christensenellales bacterium]|jgi:hypothetical protein
MIAPNHQPSSDAQASQPIRLKKRIGSTVYKVTIHYSKTSKETMGNKILRLIENDASQSQFFPLPEGKNHVQ